MKILAVAGIYGVLNLNGQIAQEPVQAEDLGEVVVTATATATEMTSNKNPMSVQVIASKEIQSTGFTRLSELVEEQTGMVLVTNRANVVGVQLQGMDPSYTLILMDGQPLVGRSTGYFDLNRIKISNIERVEIVKGASSSLYGSDALAGVINIITKKNYPKNKWNIDAASSYGTFNTLDMGIGIRRKVNKTAYELLVNGYKTEGYNFSKNTAYGKTLMPYFNYDIQPKIQIELTKNIDVLLNNRYFHQNQDYATQLKQKAYVGASLMDELNNTILVRQKIGRHLKINYEVYTTNLRMRTYIVDSMNQKKSTSMYNHWYIRPEVRSILQINRHKLVNGIGFSKELLERSDFVKTETLDNPYVFSQFEWNMNKNLLGIIGFRYDMPNVHKPKLSPKLALNYVINKNFTLKSSLGFGYKMPDLRQLYFNFFNPAIGYNVLGRKILIDGLKSLEENDEIAYFHTQAPITEDLKPESSLNFNIGGKFMYRKGIFNANIFHNAVKNLIEPFPVARKKNGQDVHSYKNIAQIFTYGTELSASYPLSANLFLQLGYQYLIAKDKKIANDVKAGVIIVKNQQGEEYTLKPAGYFGLLNRSRHSANCKIRYTMPAIDTRINLRVVYRGKFGIRDYNNNAVLDHYDQFVSDFFLVNLSISKEILKGLSGQIGSNNLFNYTDKTNIPTLSGRKVYVKLIYRY